MENILLASVLEDATVSRCLDNDISKTIRKQIVKVLSRDSVKMDKQDLEDLRDCFNSIFADGFTMNSGGLDE